MGKSVVEFALRGALLVLVAIVSMSEAQTERSYFKEGGELRLRPVQVSEKITSIVWKYDKNLLAEWMKDSIDLTYYSKFSNRSALNSDSGELVIQKMTAGDLGVYSVEINNKVQSRVYQTVMIKEVTKPTVELQPLACNRSQTCSLKCHGETTGAEPVSYSWRNDGGVWTESVAGNRKVLSSDEQNNVKTFYCRLTNPVSHKDSDPFMNRFYVVKKVKESLSTGQIVGGVIGVLVALVIVGVGFWKKDCIMEMYSSFRSKRASTNPDSPPGDDPTNKVPLTKAATSEPPAGEKDDGELQTVESGSNHTD